MKNKFFDYNLKLNDEYFLFDDENKWILVRSKHFNYEVMNSKENTEEELKQFVKEHTMYRHDFKIGIKDIILNLICLILSIININLHSNELRGLIFGMLIVTCTNSLVRIIVNEHNNEVKNKIFEEDKKRIEGIKKGEKKNGKKRNMNRCKGI